MPDHDTRFSLPGIDDPPSTEAGVILMGLDAERLLAGLGLATLADDPALVTLAVDRVRHGALTQFTAEGLIETGAARWRHLRTALAGTGIPATTNGSLRRSWEHTLRVVSGVHPGLGPGSAAYLTACWFRRAEVDALAAP
ncbi:DUF6187 family protein [Amycolatopsis sp. NPDC059657]|uniref:DUF6187 family protein n=1 Tax=Amycolatopsis sp. NPDC059657 TaxID=3346899 RepID=UPI0036730245